MKIIRIFEDDLFSFHYENELHNELERLMKRWTNAEYLFDYAINNNIPDNIGFVSALFNQVAEIENTLEMIFQGKYPIGHFLMPLHFAEHGKMLSMQKGKISRNQLRLYALKIDENCFVITGGAIKMSQKMSEHEETSNELDKLIKARNHLNANGVFDTESFYEFITEQS